MVKNLKSQKRIFRQNSYDVTAFGDTRFILPSFVWHVEPLAALGQKNDTIFYQIGCRQILSMPERDLWEIGLSMEEELYESGIFFWFSLYLFLKKNLNVWVKNYH